MQQWDLKLDEWREAVHTTKGKLQKGDTLLNLITLSFPGSSPDGQKFPVSNQLPKFCSLKFSNLLSYVNWCHSHRAHSRSYSYLDFVLRCQGLQIHHMWNESLCFIHIIMSMTKMYSGVLVDKAEWYEHVRSGKCATLSIPHYFYDLSFPMVWWGLGYWYKNLSETLLLWG